MQITKGIRVKRQQVRDTLALARSLIWDTAHDYPEKELADTPEEVCAQITQLLQDGFNYSDGLLADER